MRIVSLFVSIFLLLLCWPSAVLAHDVPADQIGRGLETNRADGQKKNVRRVVGQADSDDDSDLLFHVAATPGSIEDYDDGDLDPQLLGASLKEFEPMIGRWESLDERSEPADAILAALGISFIRRSVFRRATTQVEITDIQTTPDGRDFTTVVSFLPANTIKEGQIFIDNRPFASVDKDTGVWKSIATIADGRLLQRRESRRGVMYDVRATFASDPDGLVRGGPLHLFKWTFITRQGRKYVAHRWFYKIR